MKTEWKPTMAGVIFRVHGIILMRTVMQPQAGA